VSAEVSGVPKPGHRDTAGERRARAPASTGNAAGLECRVEWTFPNDDPLCVLHYADVEIRRMGSRARVAPRTSGLPRYTFPISELHVGRVAPDLCVDRADRRLRESLGFDVMLCGGYGGTATAGNRRHLASGSIPFYTNVGYPIAVDTERNPAKSRDAVLKMIEGTVPELRQFGGATIFFQDERHGFEDSGTATPEALGLFREYLRGRYAGIAALNAAWAGIQGFQRGGSGPDKAV